MLKGDVVTIESVQPVRGGSGGTQAASLGGQVAGGLGASIVGILAAGAVAAVASDAVEKQAGMAEIIYTHPSRPTLRRSYRQKATDDVMRLRPGDAAMFTEDAAGDLVLVRAPR